MSADHLVQLLSQRRQFLEFSEKITAVSINPIDPDAPLQTAAELLSPTTASGAVEERLPVEHRRERVLELGLRLERERAEHMRCLAKSIGIDVRLDSYRGPCPVQTQFRGGPRRGRGPEPWRCRYRTETVTSGNMVSGRGLSRISSRRKGEGFSSAQSSPSYAVPS